MAEKRKSVKFKPRSNDERIDLPCGCILEWAPSELDFDQWVVAKFCEEHDPTIKRKRL
jgi:hypothetical protein